MVLGKNKGSFLMLVIQSTDAKNKGSLLLLSVTNKGSFLVLVIQSADAKNKGSFLMLAVTPKIKHQRWDLWLNKETVQIKDT